MFDKAFRQGAERAQRGLGPWGAQHKFPQGIVIENPAAWPIALDGAPLAPRGKRARELLTLPVETSETLDARPGLLGIDLKKIMLGKRRELFAEPGCASERLQPLEQRVPQRQQVAHIIERILDLGR